VTSPVAFESVVSAAVRAFLRDEVPGLLAPAAEPRIGGTGTVAAGALRSGLLRERLDRQGVTAATTPPAADPPALLADLSWTLAMVLSPWKREVGAACDALAPAAAATGVVDTLRRDGGRVLGCNTNAAAAAAAVAFLTGDAPPGRVLVAGTGASTRSVATGLRTRWPGLAIGVWGRAPDRVADLVAALPGLEAVTDTAAWGADVVINATTVGQTDDELPGDFAPLLALRPGVRFFDLNNRGGRLPQDALAAGCVTATGIMMQLVTNALRVALLAGSPGPAHPEDRRADADVPERHRDVRPA